MNDNRLTDLEKQLFQERINMYMKTRKFKNTLKDLREIAKNSVEDFDELTVEIRIKNELETLADEVE